MQCVPVLIGTACTQMLTTMRQMGMDEMQLTNPTGVEELTDLVPLPRAPKKQSTYARFCEKIS